MEHRQAVHLWNLLAILLETEAECAKQRSDLALNSDAMKEVQELSQQMLGKQQIRLPSSAKSMPDRIDVVDPLRTPGLTALKAFIPLEIPPTPVAAELPLPSSANTGTGGGSSGTATPPANLSLSVQRGGSLHPTQIEEIRNKLLQGAQSLPPEPVRLLPQREDGDSDSDEQEERLSSSILASTLTRKSRPQFMSPPVNGEGNSLRRVSPAHMLRLDRRRSSGLSIPDQMKRRLAGRAEHNMQSLAEPARSRSLAVEKGLQTLRWMLSQALQTALVEVSGGGVL